MLCSSAMNMTHLIRTGRKPAVNRGFTGPVTGSHSCSFTAVNRRFYRLIGQPVTFGSKLRQNVDFDDFKCLFYVASHVKKSPEKPVVNRRFTNSVTGSLPL